MVSEMLTYERSVNVLAPQVYRAFTNSSALREWFCDIALTDPHPGGRLYLWWNAGYYASGEFTALTSDQDIAFTWYGQNEPSATQVQITLEPQGESTAVTVTHSGLGAGADWDETVKQFERGWHNALENLQSILETGQDLRYVRRPMLGIMLGEFNTEIAADLGVPVTEGVRLDGVVDGMGAAAAGLAKDDVIVGIAGAEVVGFPSLSSALQPHRADDEVEVVFFRGAEKRTVTMELSRRPLPEIPPTPEALSEAVRELYAEIDAELNTVFENVSDDEAAHSPAPDQWSAKETLAHLIAGERGWHTWLTNMIDDNEPVYDRWGSNVPARHTAIMAVYPSVSDMLAELKRCELETVAMLAALPTEFVARKGSYIRLGQYMLETPGYHTRDHLDQMRDAIAAARGTSS